jgi:MFS family permease
VAANELLEGRPMRALVEGGWPVLIGLLLFFLFGSFFGAISWRGPWWAIVLIAIGALILLRPLVRQRKKKEEE